MYSNSLCTNSMQKEMSRMFGCLLKLHLKSAYRQNNQAYFRGVTIRNDI